MRVLKLVLGDVRFQFKYGFYFIYGIFCIVYLLVLFALPPAWQKNAASIMIYSDPAAMGLFFMGAIVLLEKSQRVLNALAISPVKVFEYILAKVISFAFISVLVALVLAIAGGLKNILLVLVSTVLTSALFTLLGLILATKSNSLNQYLMATVPVEAICIVPPIIYVFNQSSIMRWYPLNSSVIILMNESSIHIVYDIGILVVVIGCLFLAAYKRTKNMWKSLGGVVL